MIPTTRARFQSSARQPGKARRRGVTLIEMLVAVTLLSLLSVGILYALHAGLTSLARTKARLTDNRRMAGVQRILELQLAGLVPVTTDCFSEEGFFQARLPFFQGEPQSMRFVSSYSLRDGWRGPLHILEFQVIPAPDSGGVRLIVNEQLYTPIPVGGPYCLGLVRDQATGLTLPVFRPIVVGPTSFVLADRLASCRFHFHEYSAVPPVDRWVDRWVLPHWPNAVRIEMEPLDPFSARLRHVSLTAPVRIRREMGRSYGR